MADLSKTFAALKALFATNTEGDISAQDLRDFVESVFQYGGIQMRVSDTPTAGQTIGTGYEKITQFTAGEDVSGSDISVSAANDNITVARAGIYAIHCSLSFSGSNNSTWDGSVFIDGVDADTIGFVRKLSSAGDVGSATAFGIHSVAAGEVLDYRVKADAAAKNFTLQSGMFFIFRVG